TRKLPNPGTEEAQPADEAENGEPTVDEEIVLSPTPKAEPPPGAPPSPAVAAPAAQGPVAVPAPVKKGRRGGTDECVALAKYYNAVQYKLEDKTSKQYRLQIEIQANAAKNTPVDKQQANCRMLREQLQAEPK